MQTTPQSVLSEMERQVGNATMRLATKFPWAAEDIAQDAWVGAHQALPYFDPCHPGAAGFFYRAAVQWAGEQVARYRSVATISRQEARTSVAAVRVPIEDRQDRLGVMPTAAEDAMLIREASRQVARLRVRYRRAVEAAARGLDVVDRMVGYLLEGMDGPPQTVAQVCREMGMWRSDVEECARVWRQRLDRKRSVRELRQQIAEIEEQLP